MRQPASLFRPKTYLVPSPVMTVQCSPLLSPLSASVERVTVEASSFASRQVLSQVPETLTSRVALPFRTSWALSYFQQLSKTSSWPSSSHEPYERSM